MSERNDGGPAFPLFFPESKTREGKILRARDERPGMSLRDYFAAHALIAIGAPTWASVKDRAQVSYEIADAMLGEREK